MKTKLVNKDARDGNGGLRGMVMRGLGVGALRLALGLGFE